MKLKFSKIFISRILAVAFSTLLPVFWFHDLLAHKTEVKFSGIVLLTLLLFAFFTVPVIILWKNEEKHGHKKALAFFALSILLFLFPHHFFVFVFVLAIFSIFTAIVFRLLGLHRIIKIVKGLMYVGILPSVVVISLKMFEFISSNEVLLDDDAFEGIWLWAYLFAKYYIVVLSFFVPLFIFDFICRKNKKWKRFLFVIIPLFGAMIFSSTYCSDILKKQLDPCYDFAKYGFFKNKKYDSWFEKDDRVCIRYRDFRRTLVGADPKTFEEYSRVYSKDKNSVYYLNSKIMHNADSETFDLLDGAISSYDYYAKDSNRVYYDGEEIQGADPQTFRRISEEYSVDKEHVYRGAKMILGADPKTFEVIDDYKYSRDAKSIFYYDRLIESSDSSKLELLENDDYVKTADRVYYKGDEIQDADVETFELFSGQFSRDKSAVYFNDKKHYNFDPVSFHRIGNSDFYADKENVSYGSTILESANLETFQVLNDTCATDGEHYFIKSEMVERLCTRDELRESVFGWMIRGIFSGLFNVVSVLVIR